MADENDRIERDDNGRSDIQPEQQGEYAGGRQASERSDADHEQSGGSSGSGGYGNAENQQHHQGTGQSGVEPDGDLGQSRGAKFDEAQGGGRAPDEDFPDYGGPKGG